MSYFKGAKTGQQIARARYADGGDVSDDDRAKGIKLLGQDMTRDKNNPWQRSMRGLAEGETLKASGAFRNNWEK